MANQAQANVVAVCNNRESLVQLQLPSNITKDRHNKETKSGVNPGPVIQLLPGMNFVDADKWAVAKENPIVQKLLSEKIKPSRAPEQNPERIGLPTLEEGPTCSKDNPLASLSDGDAVAMVDELFDVPMMKRFLDQESRTNVAVALKTQITKIEKVQGTKK